MGLHAYLKPRLYDKIGILSDNHRWLYMPDGLEIGGGGLFATLEDNLRLMKLYADGGVWDGEQILAPEYVKAAISLQMSLPSEARVNPPAKDKFCGLWLSDLDVSAQRCLSGRRCHGAVYDCSSGIRI